MQTIHMVRFPLQQILDDAPFIRFEWESLHQGKKVIERAAMYITAHIPNSTQALKFQLDTGLAHNLLFDIPVTEQLGLSISEIPNNMTLEFNDKHKKLVSFKSMQNFGELTSSATMPEIGILGLDFLSCANAGFAIDYKNQNIYLLTADHIQQINGQYPLNFNDYINMDAAGNTKIMLPYQIGEKTKLALFDTGSSMFELVIAPDQWQEITNLSLTDEVVETVDASAWGNTMTVFKAPTNHALYISGQCKKLTQISTLFPFHLDMPTIMGSGLFLDDIVVVDSINAKFGIIDAYTELAYKQDRLYADIQTTLVN